MSSAPVAPPLPSATLLIFLGQLVLLLLVARSLGRLAERCRLPAVVGELATGLILGPSLLGWALPAVEHVLFPATAEQMNLLDAVGQLGLMLLVGVTGAQLDLTGFRRSRSVALRISLLGLLVPLGLGIAIGALLAGALSDPGRTPTPVVALFIGVAMCVTAIPVIGKTLSDMHLVHRNVGQLILTAGMVDDIVGWCMLSVVAAAATTGLAAGSLTGILAALVAFLAFAYLVGRPLVRRLMTRADRSPAPTRTVATAVIVMLTGSVITQAIGLEAIFGAFVAGILIGRRGAANLIKLAPLRTLVTAVLAPIFLACAGLRMDITALFDARIWPVALAVVVVAILGKYLGAYVGARLGRMGHWEAVAIGSGMNARGVVEVIVALTGLRLGVLNTAAYTIVVLVAIVTSVMAPPMLRLAMGRVEQSEEERLRELDQNAWNGALLPREPSRQPKLESTDESS